MRGVHRNDGGGGQPIGIVAEVFSGNDVVRAAGRTTNALIGKVVKLESRRGIEHGKVDAELLEPLVEQTRKHCARPVAHVLRGNGPERLLGKPPAAALCHRHRQTIPHQGAKLSKSFLSRLSPDSAHLLVHEGRVLEPMAIGVDHRMGKSRANGCCVFTFIAAHMAPLVGWWAQVQYCQRAGLPWECGQCPNRKSRRSSRRSASTRSRRFSIAMAA